MHNTKIRSVLTNKFVKSTLYVGMPYVSTLKLLAEYDKVTYVSMAKFNVGSRLSNVDFCYRDNPTSKAFEFTKYKKLFDVVYLRYPDKRLYYESFDTLLSLWIPCVRKNGYFLSYIPDNKLEECKKGIDIYISIIGKEFFTVEYDANLVIIEHK